jgi:hypothetical protein
MHFNFHLSGDESAEQTRRIANAVLALGGAQLVPDDEVNIKLDATPELMAFFNGQSDHPRKGPQPSTKVGEMHVEVNIDTTNATAALDKLATHPGAKWVEEDAVTANVGESPSGGLRYSTVIPETGIEIPCEPMSANEIKELVSSPAVPVAQAADPSGLDSKGLPWDERIHSGSRKFNADGSWRYRKNVPDETKAAVEGELRGLMAIMAPTIAATEAISEACDKLEAMMPSQPGVTDIVEVTVPTSPVVPPAPPVPTVEVTEVNGTVHHVSAVPPPAAARTYPDVVNLIMSRKIAPETYVAIIGSDLPTFAATCKTDPNAASVAFDALDRASRS